MVGARGHEQRDLYGCQVEYERIGCISPSSGQAGTDGDCTLATVEHLFPAGLWEHCTPTLAEDPHGGLLDKRENYLLFKPLPLYVPQNKTS